METIEVNFLLKLLGKQDFRASIRDVSPNSKTSASERDRICRRLCDRELVACSYEITKFRIAPTGKELLESDFEDSSVTSQELKVLKACEKKTITPGQSGIPTTERQPIIHSLAERGLIQVDKKDRKIKEVWLTERGKEYLLEEYSPRGAGNITLTKTILADYFDFLRQSLLTFNSEDGKTARVASLDKAYKVSDEEILRTIVDLDRRLRRSYLPIFYLREKLQPPLSRDELDQALFRLEKKGEIELSAITRGWRYSEQELNTGIPQRAGSRLFFITLK